MPTLTPLPAKPKTLSGKVYLQLKKRIAEGKLPPRTRLLTEHLARDLGVSATPLREALRMLHKDGLVSLTPNKRQRRGLGVRLDVDTRRAACIHSLRKPQSP